MSIRKPDQKVHVSHACSDYMLRQQFITTSTNVIYHVRQYALEWSYISDTVGAVLNI